MAAQNFDRLPAPDRALTGTNSQRAALITLGGRSMTRATAEVSASARGWTATLRGLSRPGRVASLFFSDGVREVVLRLGDGRSAQARLSTTSFVDGERICQLKGLEPLS